MSGRERIVGVLLLAYLAASSGYVIADGIPRLGWNALRGFGQAMVGLTGLAGVVLIVWILFWPFTKGSEDG
jgi:hypothetical protein